MKYIKNLEDQTQSVLAEDVAKDAAEVSGLDPDAVSDAVAGLNFASYLELGNAIANEDGELVRELLNISDVVPDEPIADDEIDLEEDNGYKHTETLICERCRGDGTDAWGETCDKCGGKGRLTLDGEYFEESTVEEEKLLDKPTPSLKDLAKKHDRSLADMGSQLAKGIKAEKEHTTDMLVAKEIALDHLSELPDYYDRLEKMEESIDKGAQIRFRPHGVYPFTYDGDTYPLGKKVSKQFPKNNEVTGTVTFVYPASRTVDVELDQPVRGTINNRRQLIRKVTVPFGNILNEADNPYSAPTASPAPTAATPPSAGSSIDALAQPADTATDVDDQEVQQGRKEVDDLQIGDQIEVADIDGQPAAGRVRNIAGPGDTLVITGKGDEEHMIRKDSILSTPMIPVAEKKQSRLDKTHLGQKNKRADRVEKKKAKDVQEADNVRGTYRVSYNNDKHAPDHIGYWEDSEYRAVSAQDAMSQAEQDIGKSDEQYVWPVKAKLIKKFRAIGGPNKDQEVLVDDYEVDEDAMREAYEAALEGKYDYNKRDKGKGQGITSPMYDGGAENRKNRKAFRKAEKAKAHQARMRGEIEEGYGEETYDEMVEYWKGSLSRSIVSKGVFTQMYDAAGQDIEVLNAAIEEEAHSIAETYHGSGDGIGSSDQNHFVASVARTLGIEDVFGWNKKKGVLKSKEEMDRDMTNRVAKYRKSTQAESLDEGIDFHFFVDPQEVGANVMNSKGDIHDHYDSEEEALAVAKDLNAQYGEVDEDFSRICELAGIKETASGGGTGAGAIASSPVAVGGVQKRNPSIYGQTKLTKKPTPKKRETKEDSSAGIGRGKKA